MDSDSTIRNIVKEITRECTYKGIHVYENFVMYYVKLLGLDPHWQIAPNMDTCRADVQKFIKFVVSKLEFQQTPGIVTLKMQLYFSCNFEKRLEMVKRNRSELMLRLKRLKDEIVADIYECDLPKMYQKIVYYISLGSGLGNPTVKSVFAEIEAALKSVFNITELNEFMEQQKNEKEDQLESLVKIVTGIRLFNKDCAKAGEGMEELPKLLTKSLEATTNEFEKILDNIMNKVNLLTSALDNSYITNRIKKNDYELVCKLPDNITIGDINEMKDFLIVYRQYEVFMRKLMDEVKLIENTFNKTLNRFEDTLRRTHDVVRTRIAIPVSQVFPSFEELSEIWSEMQDQSILLAKINQIANNLDLYVKQLNFNDTVATMLTKLDGILSDIDRLERTNEHYIKLESKEVEVIDTRDMVDIDEINLEYLGFCAWKLIESQGALLPGNSGMGVVKVLGMNYVFSCLEAAKTFGQDPERFILNALDMVRRKPELINFLKLKDHLTEIQDVINIAVTPPPPEIIHRDVNFQTEAHPIEVNIDKKYKWNIWDWKREAIKLANLAKTKTVSTQTTKSSMRVRAKAQTTEMRDKHLQTKTDNYTNVPTLSTFIYGLRGRKDEKQFVLDLTQPVDPIYRNVCKVEKKKYKN